MKRFFSLAAALCALGTTAFVTACDEDTLPGLDLSIRVKSLRFIGEKIVPFQQSYNGTTLGGFSGIDYRADNDSYYIMCDDASALQPVRYYTAKLAFDKNSFTDVSFTSVTTLKRPDGSNYPSATADRYNAIDPEGIRYDAATKHIVWTSEGVRNVTVAPPVLTSPFLRESTTEGTFVADYLVPPIFQIKATENGTRSNGSFEGLSFTPDGQYTFTASEEPLYEDGPRADVNVEGSPIRIIKYDKSTRQPIAQYAYRLAAVHKAPIPGDQFRLNGVVEVLALSDTKLLAMERSYAVGATPDYSVKIYEIDLTGATDVSNMTLQGTSYTTVSKRLVLDVATTGINRVDNIEGFTFGPKLSNGHRSLVLVSDDNFSSSAISQFLVFEVIP
ncbi:esterase-like activity of phytase family protein [Hymenobacter cavernae]|uniref:Phytase n=1 Tax=Hymenobacter cavernae TaxID=2044852 RepID=A0ABQ1TR50_9BACT|nr:esterase-like activity of phytase family protein [Hymenobacter cavernae]GGE99180.1 phytase [Hymenobacter cavernae]